MLPSAALLTDDDDVGDVDVDDVNDVAATTAPSPSALPPLISRTFITSVTLRTV